MHQHGRIGYSYKQYQGPANPLEERIRYRAAGSGVGVVPRPTRVGRGQTGLGIPGSPVLGSGGARKAPQIGQEGRRRAS